MTTKMTACWSSPRRTFRYKRRNLIEKDECVVRNGKWKKKERDVKKEMLHDLGTVPYIELTIFA